MYERDATVKKSTLSILTLLFGWLGSHKFYIGNDMAGALYFVVTVLGFVFTVYEPLMWETWYGFHINVGILILLAPLVVSIVEFILLQGQDEFTVQHKYRGTSDPLSLTFVAQGIYIIILLLPLLYRFFTRVG
jgi:hypothetical protein